MDTAREVGADYLFVSWRGMREMDMDGGCQVLMLSLSLPVYQVRLDWMPLPCIALIRPSQLSCLSSSVESICLASSMSWFGIPPEQLFIIFHGNRLPCFVYVGLALFM